MLARFSERGALPSSDGVFSGVQMGTQQLAETGAKAVMCFESLQNKFQHCASLAYVVACGCMDGATSSM